jgi:hypothetical protein
LSAVEIGKDPGWDRSQKHSWACFAFRKVQTRLSSNEVDSSFHSIPRQGWHHGLHLRRDAEDFTRKSTKYIAWVFFIRSTHDRSNPPAPGNIDFSRQVWRLSVLQQKFEFRMSHMPHNRPRLCLSKGQTKRFLDFLFGSAIGVRTIRSSVESETGVSDSVFSLIRVPGLMNHFTTTAALSTDRLPSQETCHKNLWYSVA